MRNPPCHEHGVERNVCVSADIGARLHVRAPLDLRCRPIHLAYPDQPAEHAFAIAWLTDADYARAEHRAAGRLPDETAYADDPWVEAKIRELLAEDIPLLIGRKARRGPLNDFGLIESSKRHMRLVCPLCIEKALAAAGHVMQPAPRA